MRVRMGEAEMEKRRMHGGARNQGNCPNCYGEQEREAKVKPGIITWEPEAAGSVLKARRSQGPWCSHPFTLFSAR